MTTLVYEGQRAFDDLLLAERQLRAHSENQVRELRQLLLETAVRLDGQRFEAIRREDPSVPNSWMVSEWSAFLKHIPSAQGWKASVVPLNAAGEREKELTQQVESLRSQLDDAFVQLEQERERVETATRNIAEMASTIKTSVPGDVITTNASEDAIELPDGIELSINMVPSMKFVIADVQACLEKSQLPQRPPSGFGSINGGNRVGGDLDEIYRRYWAVVYAMGRWMLSVKTEIESVVGLAMTLGERTGSLKNVIDSLVDAGMIVREKLELETPRTAMFVNRLSEDGERLYRELFKSNPAQSEWARLIEKGCGTDRTLAALFFNMHARRCGWATQLFPDMQLEGASTDLWIGKGAESCYVDIAFHRNSNWKKLALTGNKIFIFAGTADLRQRLKGDCKLDQVAGVANDIETLAAMKYKRLNHKSNLWADEW